MLHDGSHTLIGYVKGKKTRTEKKRNLHTAHIMKNSIQRK